MKDDTKAKCKKAVDYMVEYRVGIKKAAENFCISVGSIHRYIYHVLRYEDDETYNVILEDMKRRYKKGW